VGVGGIGVGVGFGDVDEEEEGADVAVGDVDEDDEGADVGVAPGRLATTTEMVGVDWELGEGIRVGWGIKPSVVTV
jgi:hypothetical protein